MSRSRRVFNAFWMGIVNQVIVAVFGLWVTRFSIHRVGEHDYGLWVIAAQAIGYMTLLELGIVALLPRDIAVAEGKEVDTAERDLELRMLCERSVSLVLFVVALLAVGSVGIVALMPAQWEPLRGPLTLYLALYTASYPLRIFTAVLNGLQDFQFLAQLQILSFVVTSTTTIVLILAGFGLYALALGVVVGPISTGLAAAGRLFVRRRGVLPRRFRWPSSDVLREHLAPSFWMTLNHLAIGLLNSTDILVIGRIGGPEGALIFSLTDKAENVAGQQPYAIANLSGPRLAELKGAGRQGDLVRMIGVIVTSTLIASGAVVLAILETNKAFVRTWIGSSYYGGTALTATILANMMLRHWQLPYSSTIYFYGGRIRAQTFIILVDGVLSFALSILLVLRIGIVGAPLGSLISVLLTSLPAGIFLAAREADTSVRSMIEPVIPWLVRFVPLAALAGFTGVWLGDQSLFVVAAAGAVIGVIYIALMLPILRRPPLDAYAAPYLAKIPLLSRLPGANAGS